MPSTEGSMVSIELTDRSVKSRTASPSRELVLYERDTNITKDAGLVDLSVVSGDILGSIPASPSIGSERIPYGPSKPNRKSHLKYQQDSDSIHELPAFPSPPTGTGGAFPRPPPRAEIGGAKSSRASIYCISEFADSELEEIFTVDRFKSRALRPTRDDVTKMLDLEEKAMNGAFESYGLRRANGSDTSPAYASETTEVELPPGFEPTRPQRAARPNWQGYGEMHSQPGTPRPLSAQSGAPIFDACRPSAVQYNGDGSGNNGSSKKNTAWGCAKAFMHKQSRKPWFYLGFFISLMGVLIVVIILPKKNALDLQSGYVEIRDLTITDPLEDDFKFTLSLNVKKDNMIEGGMGQMLCGLYSRPNGAMVDGSDYAQSFIGKLETDNFRMMKNQPLQVKAYSKSVDPGNRNWGELIAAVFAGQDEYRLQIDAEGSYATSLVNWAIGFRKLVSVVGALDVTEAVAPNRYGMGDFLVSYDKGDLSYTARTVFANPSRFSSFLGNATLNLLIDDVVIGRHVIPDLMVVPEDNFVPFLAGNLYTDVIKNGTMLSKFYSTAFCWTCVGGGRFSVLGISAEINGTDVPYLTQGMKAVNRSAALLPMPPVTDGLSNQLTNITFSGMQFVRSEYSANIAQGSLRFGVMLPVDTDAFSLKPKNAIFTIFFHDALGVPYAELHLKDIPLAWQLSSPSFTTFDFISSIGGSALSISNQAAFDEHITQQLAIGHTRVLMSGLLSLAVESPLGNGTIVGMRVSQFWADMAGFVVVPTPVAPWRAPSSTASSLSASTVISTTVASTGRISISTSSTMTSTEATSKVYVMPTFTPGFGSVLKMQKREEDERSELEGSLVKLK